MAFYNEVKPGDVFQPSANLHNDTIRLINKMNGISEATTKGKGSGATVLKVYNPTDVDFAPGTPVNFDNDQAIVEEHVPVMAYSDDQAPWGVLKDGLQANSFGSCIVSGPVTISLSGEGKYAVPRESGFELAEEQPEGNSALVLHNNGSNAVICLGAGGGGGASDPFPSVVIGEITNFGSYDTGYPVKITLLNGKTEKVLLQCLNASLGTQGYFNKNNNRVLAIRHRVNVIGLEK